MSKPPARIDDEIKVDKHGGGKIASSQATVTFEGKEVACAGDKVKHKDGTETTLKAGNSCVLVNGKPVALLGDETEADGKVNSAASTIKIDEGKPFVFIGPNVHIGKNVSFNVKKSASDASDKLLAGLGVLDMIAGTALDEFGVGEVLQIAGYKMTKHALERAAERKVTKEAIEDALKNPLKITEPKIRTDGLVSQKYIGKQAEVAVNPGNGNIVSVNPTHTRIAKKLIEENANGS